MGQALQLNSRLFGIDLQKDLILLDLSFFWYFLCKQIDPRHRAGHVTSINTKWNLGLSESANTSDMFKARKLNCLQKRKWWRKKSKIYFPSRIFETGIIYNTRNENGICTAEYLFLFTRWYIMLHDLRFCSMFHGRLDSALESLPRFV